MVRTCLWAVVSAGSVWADTPTGYACSMGQSVTVTPADQNALHLEIGDVRLEMSPVPAASGAKYAANAGALTIVWWSRGTGGVLYAENSEGRQVAGLAEECEAR
ncbi:MliC family protein [uncultured Roseobacter sp.]|uniref:MliC family protein n=1 Tax=uncultured Roseobacter sp. TaxID=114847 RepID=UPI00260996CB|nr:MliC family protein [uncultured Roseobacter sp.]